MAKTASPTWLILGLMVGVLLNVSIDAQACTKNQFACEDGKCISPSWVCDGSEDCDGGIDESSCAPRTCSAEEFRCKHNGECIPKRWLCDGDHDCPDESDEDVNICNNRTCDETQFACAGGMCISKDWKCDDQWDCPGGEDEQNCSERECASDEFLCDNKKCITYRWTCDRDNDCGDNSDEHDCPETTCATMEFMCKNSTKCIPSRWHCDGDQDCHDNSDETECASSSPTETSVCSDQDFMCLNHDCIHKSWQCDGESDCLDGSDELHCEKKTCASNQFQCVANHMCIFGYLQCNGIAECEDKSDEVDCEKGHSTCDPKKEFDCSGDGSQCLPLDKVCNGKGDCIQSQDEAHDLCYNTTNPCDNKNGNCSHTCVHTYGQNYYCSCPTGFEITTKSDNTTCKDIDECQVAGTCSQVCLNRPGSFKCECKTGYQLDHIYSQTAKSKHITATYCRAMGSTPHLLFANRHDLRKFHLESGKYNSVVEKLRSAVAVDYDYEDKMVYWSDVANEQIIRANIDNATDESSHQKLVVSNTRTPDGIAFDWVHKNLYWTDAGLDTLEVMDVDENLYRKVLFRENMDEPRAIVVDPRHEQGFIYWSDWGEKARIERAGLDGSNRHTIVDTDIEWPNGLAIDYADNRLYWIDAKLRAIISSNLVGEDKRTVLTSYSQVRHPFAITVFEDHVYWTDWETESIRRVNKFNGKDLENVVISLYSPMDIQVYHPVRQPGGINKCAAHDCSHMCLPSPYINEHSAKYKCDCPETHKMDINDKDGKTCTLIATKPPTIPAQTTPAGKAAATDKPDPATNLSKGPLGESQPHDMGKIAGIVVGVLLGVIIIIAVVGCILYRSYTRKNIHSMNFDNPVYRKTTEDQFSLEKHQYQPSKSLPSTLEPLTSSQSNNEYV